MAIKPPLLELHLKSIFSLFYFERLTLRSDAFIISGCFLIIIAAQAKLYLGSLTNLFIQIKYTFLLEHGNPREVILQVVIDKQVDTLVVGQVGITSSRRYAKQTVWLVVLIWLAFC